MAVTRFASSAMTAVTTTTDAALELRAASKTALNNFIFYNTSAFLGFISLDGGTHWAPVPAHGVLTVENTLIFEAAIQLKRVASSSNDVTGHWFAWARKTN